MGRQEEELVARIEDLESRAAFQEDTLAQLNEVIASQDAQIRALVVRLRELGDKYRDLTVELQGPAGAGGDEKPPHY